MPYRTDARALRDPPEWLVRGNRRSLAIAWLVTTCALGAIGALAEFDERSHERWHADGDVTHVPIPGFDPGLTEPAPSCAYFIPYRMYENVYCGTVAPFVIPRDPMLGCPTEDEIRTTIGAPSDQWVERLRGPPWDEVE